MLGPGPEGSPVSPGSPQAGLAYDDKACPGWTEPGQPWMTTKRLVAMVKARIQVGWTRLAPAAENAKGDYVAAYSEAAVRWSLLGAVNALDVPDSKKFAVLGRLRVFTKATLTEFNQSCSRVEDVIALLERVEASLEG